MPPPPAVDARRFLDLPADFGLNDLKTAYKAMIVKVHPDKGGSEHLFKLASACYKELKQELAKRDAAAKGFEELKAEARTAGKKRGGGANPAGEGRFDVARFNETFEAHRQETDDDRGYGQFLRDTGPTQSAKKLTRKQFDRLFAEETDRLHRSIRSSSSSSSSLAPPAAVQAVQIVQPRTAYVELGADRVNDFSAGNLCRKSLHFSDLLLAHTTSRIHPVVQTVAPPTPPLLSDGDAAALRKARDHGTFAALSEREKLALEREEAIAETRRQERVRAADEKTAIRFLRLMQGSETPGALFSSNPRRTWNR